MPNITIEDTEWLRRDEYMDDAPDEPGTTVSIRHCHPTKPKLYVTRTDDGTTILAYCHHCGKRGHYTEAFSKVTRRDTTATPIDARVRTLPYDYDTDYDKFPVKGRVWLGRSDCTKDEIRGYGIGYSPQERGIILPIYNHKLVGYQVRGLEEGMPKYTTRTWDKPNTYWMGGLDCDTLVIVEDILSGIVVGRHYRTLALLGVHLTDNMLSSIINYNNYIIWLDNDNSIVKKKQLSIKLRLSLFGNSNIIYTNKDPKNSSTDVINYVEGAIHGK